MRIHRVLAHSSRKLGFFKLFELGKGTSSLKLVVQLKLVLETMWVRLMGPIRYKESLVSFH